ncbi:hypothetical protein CK489_09065 [Bradyrhizobium sp. UFLA03-84]|uniref:hypothetical protein n=1 Tax=Bradyrhizobium sp. UFLA03-84 TaxID=418599 RepID=UPI000BADDAC6|nr:hypothetical protein [Bradyrhizobium sp. UFLA03-84]PAY09465.1 hypothetical protein CK489_09065 [Bradyrhizobium sp. UFLA03-84]
MRKLILIAAMVLISASAQAGERSLSLGGAGSLPATASNSVITAGKVADPPVVPAVAPPVAPKYVERAAPVAPPAPAPQPQAQPAAQQAPAQQQENVRPSVQSDARPAPQQPTNWHRSSHRRHARRWTEGRIIGELHRHGIYW